MQLPASKPQDAAATAANPNKRPERYVMPGRIDAFWHAFRGRRRRGFIPTPRTIAQNYESNSDEVVAGLLCRLWDEVDDLRAIVGRRKAA